MKNYLICLLCICLVINIFSQEETTIPRDNTHLRDGPGCFYPVIKVLSKGSKVNKLDQEDKWIQIRYQHKVGWISQNTLKNCDSKDPLDQKIELDTSNISQASMSGAVRGFAEKYIAQSDGSSEFIEKYGRKLITPEEYLSFKTNTYNQRNPQKLEQRYKLPPNSNIPHITLQSEKIGLAVASRIAEQGLVQDSNKTKYINYVGTLVTEKSSGYHYPVKFYIVKDSKPAAYCTPSGSIFITQGLINHIQNEAELACLLGHELAHFIHKHGQLEIKNRETRIKANQAFQKLEEELGSKQDSKLTSLANDLYEAASARRQLKFEYEADRLGVIYAYRAGYDPDAYIALLQRILNNTNIDYKNFESEWESFYLDRRIKKIRTFIDHNLDKKRNLDVKNKARFDDFMQ